MPACASAAAPVLPRPCGRWPRVSQLLTALPTGCPVRSTGNPCYVRVLKQDSADPSKVLEVLDACRARRRPEPEDTDDELDDMEGEVRYDTRGVRA